MPSPTCVAGTGSRWWACSAARSTTPSRETWIWPWAFAPGAPRDILAVVNALGDLIPGDHVDMMDLDRADPVAQRAATDRWRILFESNPSVHAEREIKAYKMFEDTRWLRRLQQESLLS